MLCLVALGLGLFLGNRALPTETDVINAGAALYVEDTGRPREECVGLASETAWIEVRCGDGSVTKTYVFNRRGGRVTPSKEPSI